MRAFASLIWSITIFMVVVFLQPGLIARACMANPTNYWNAVPVDQANIVPIVDERITQSDETPKPKVWGLVIAFIIAILVIAYIISQIIRLLDKVIPPEKKPDPPPQSGNTNYPAVVVNPNTGPGPATTVVHKMDVGKTVIYSSTNGCTITNYDIVTFMFPNTWEKGSPNLIFDHYWRVGMKSTTDLINWEETHYEVECFYTTSVGVFYRYQHYGTNYYQCYYRSDYIASNHSAPAYFDLTDRPYRSTQFFRLEAK